MTNNRRYIEVSRRAANGLPGELDMGLDIGQRFVWFFKMTDGVLMLDHHVEQRRCKDGWNGIAWWNRDPESSSVRCAYQAIAATIPQDVWDEAEARRGGIREDAPEDPCWGAAP